MANTDESGVHDRYGPIPRRYLCCDGIGRNGPEAGYPRCEKARHRPSAGAGGQLGPEGSPRPRRPRAGERCHQHPVHGARSPDRLDDRADRFSAFHIDVPAKLRPRAEELLQQGELASVGQLARTHLGPTQPAQNPWAVRNSVERWVVKGDSNSVCRCPDVGLHVAVAQRNRVFEGGPTVLGRLACASAVGERERPWVVQIGRSRGHCAPKLEPMDIGPLAGYGLAVSDTDFSSARLVPVAGSDGWLARLPGAVVWVPGDGQDERELVAACLTAASPSELLARTGSRLVDPETTPLPAFAILAGRDDGLVAIVHGPVQVTVDQDGDERTLYGGEETGSWLNRHVKGARAAWAGRRGDEDDLAELRDGLVRASGFVLSWRRNKSSPRQTSQRGRKVVEDPAPAEIGEPLELTEEHVSSEASSGPAASSAAVLSAAVAISSDGADGVSSYVAPVESDTSYVGVVDGGAFQAGVQDADSPTVVDQPIVVNGSPSPLVKLTWDNGEVNELTGAALVGRDVALDEAVLSGELAALVPGGQNDSMSRVHAEVRPSMGDIVVVDRGSTNGTFVWDDAAKAWHRLSPGDPHVVHPGAVLAFGERTATLEAIAVPAV